MCIYTAKWHYRANNTSILIIVTKEQNDGSHWCRESWCRLLTEEYRQRFTLTTKVKHFQHTFLAVGVDVFMTIHLFLVKINFCVDCTKKYELETETWCTNADVIPKSAMFRQTYAKIEKVFHRKEFVSVLPTQKREKWPFWYINKCAYWYPSSCWLCCFLFWWR